MQFTAAPLPSVYAAVRGTPPAGGSVAENVPSGFSSPWPGLPDAPPPGCSHTAARNRLASEKYVAGSTGPNTAYTPNFVLAFGSNPEPVTAIVDPPAGFSPDVGVTVTAATPAFGVAFPPLR